MLKYQVYLISLFVILFSIHVFAETRINEVMYNPKGTDNHKEFVEIYSDDQLDLNNFTISDGDSEDKLVKLNDISSNYALIVETDYILNIPDNIALYSAGAAIGNALSEDDRLILYDQNKSEITSMQIFKIPEGYSLEYFNGNYYQSLNINGTPGSENSIREIPKETVSAQDNTTEEPKTSTNLNSDSTIEIKEVIPKTIRFGDNISVKVDVYRGSTAKYAVYFYIERDNKTIMDKISEHARTKYQNYTFTYSTQLEPNCNNKYEEGKYDIIVEGLEKSVSKEIEISGNIQCENDESNSAETDTSSDTKEQIINKQVTESNINQASPITGNIVYESSDMKAKGLALYLLCFVLILVTVYLIKRNKDGNNNQNNNRDSGIS